MSEFTSAVAGGAVVACMLGFSGAAFAQTAAEPNTAQSGRAAALIAQGAPAKSANDPACPRVVILRGSESFPKSGDSHRATVEGLARDCANLGAETLLKVGVVGEATRSGQGSPSWFNAPLSIAVVDDQGRAVAVSKARIRIQLPRGKTEGPFTHVVEELSLPPSRSYAGWSVVVGFAATAAEAQAAAKVLTAGR